jgi:hypothetical protein
MEVVMPLPLAPLVPIVLRLGAVAAAGFALRRAVAARVATGRTDQRAEDALDDLDDGMALHRPADRAADGDSQTNTAARMRRTIRWGKRAVEIDAALLARFRIRRV